MKSLLAFAADPVRKKAIFALVLLGWLTMASTFNKFPLSQSLIAAVLTVVHSFYVVWLIFVLRGEESRHKTNPLVVTSIGVWGYIWRAFVTTWLSSLLMVLVLGLEIWLFGVKPPRTGALPLEWMLSMNVVIIAVMPVTCWLLFSRDRKGQLLWLTSAIR